MSSSKVSKVFTVKRYSVSEGSSHRSADFIVHESGRRVQEVDWGIMFAVTNP